MIFTICFDNIKMMSHFVELCHNVIENQWNPCVDFLRRDKMNAQELSRFCFNVRRTAAMSALSVALLWGPQTFFHVCQILTVPCWWNFSIFPPKFSNLPTPPPQFDRNTYRIVSNKRPGGVAIFQKGDVYKRQVFNAKMQCLSLFTTRRREI